VVQPKQLERGKITMGNLPFMLSYTDGDKHIRLVMEKEKLTVEEANALATHLSYFIQEMDKKPKYNQ